MKKSIITIIGVFVLFYLAGSFGAASFNLKDWDPVLRIIAAIFGVALSLIIIDSNKNK